MEIIKASDLRIGNYVSALHGNVQIEKFVNNGVHFTDGNGGNFQSLSPIPLSPEWLQRAGFDKRVIDGNGNEFEDGIGWGLLNFYLIHAKADDKSWQYFLHHYANDVAIHYVHQLQNLYYALTGTELTFNQP